MLFLPLLEVAGQPFGGAFILLIRFGLADEFGDERTTLRLSNLRGITFWAVGIDFLIASSFIT